MARNFSQTPLIEQRSATTLRLRHLMEEQQRVEIGQRIRELRNASPHTNRSIADHVDVGERAVANWIAGKTGLTYEHAKKVAELFDVDVRWLWDGKERGPTPDVLGALTPDQLDSIEDKLDWLIASETTRRVETGRASGAAAEAARKAAEQSPPAPRQHGAQASG